jgi:hypothetical protein
VLGRCCSELCFVISDATRLVHVVQKGQCVGDYGKQCPFSISASIWIIAPRDYQINEPNDPSFEWVFFSLPPKIWKSISQTCAGPLMVILLSLFGAGLLCFNNISEDDLTSYKVVLQPHDACGLGELEDDEYLTMRQGSTSQEGGLRRRRDGRK